MGKVPRTWGLLAQYKSAPDIFHACETVRDQGYSKWDACTPFPVHGLEHAMGLKPSRLPWFVLCGGITGCVFAMAFMLWVNVVDYPLNIGGKPFASVPAFIPITFELTVLFSAFTTFFGLWFLCRLPQFYNPLFSKPNFERVTNDMFYIIIEAADPRFQLDKTRQLLEQSGAVVVEEVED